MSMSSYCDYNLVHDGESISPVLTGQGPKAHLPLVLVAATAQTASESP